MQRSGAKSQRYTYKIILAPKAQEEGVGRKIVRARGSVTLLSDCLLVMSDAILIKSHQHDYLNIT